MKDHLRNLVSALVNLSPSRNIISQLILLLPRDLRTIEYSYPEISSPEAKEILAQLGVRLENTVRRENFANKLYEFIHKLFDWLDDELVKNVRLNLAKLTGLNIDSLPNPYAEWAELVLRKIVHEKNRVALIDLLRKLSESEEYCSERDLQTLLNEIRKKFKLNPAEFEEIVQICIGSEEERIESLKPGSYGYSSEYFEYYLRHSEYHLDIILHEYRYSAFYHKTDYYRLRHRNTLREILRRVNVEEKSKYERG